MSEKPKRVFKCKLEGEYYSLSDVGVKGIRQYNAVFRLPSADAALSVIKNKLLDAYLKRHYKDYTSFRTYRMVSMEVEGQQPDPAVANLTVNNMNFEQLADYCVLKRLPVDPYKYGSVAAAREEVHKALANNKIHEDEIARMAEQDAADNELRKLNELPEVRGGVEIEEGTPSTPENIAEGDTADPGANATDPNLNKSADSPSDTSTVPPNDQNDDPKPRSENTTAPENTTTADNLDDL